jgi:MerR family transcriptional regulator/heat shock protein HspR
VNLAGIKRILELEHEVERLRRQVEYLRAFAEPGRRVFTAHPSGDVVAMGRGQRRAAREPVGDAERQAGAIVLWRPGGGR